MSDRDIESVVGRRLRTRRRLLGLSQEQLGHACGVRFQQIQKYESGVNRISAIMLWKLATALGVTVAYFFEGAVADHPPPSRTEYKTETRPGPP